MRTLRTLASYLLLLGGTLTVVACSSWAPAPVIPPTQWLTQLGSAPLPAVWLLGEQHDAPDHHAWEQATVHTLAQRQQLAALVLEMADAGLSTHGLPPTATDAEVQQALQWDTAGWPWSAYGPTVMTAVRAGVPVLGGNLPRAQMRAAMQQTELDQHLPAPAWAQQRAAIRSGHCDLLPAAQITPMARIQLAKDARMAQTVSHAVQPGKTVVLVAGRGHVLRSVGIPTWLPPTIPTRVAIAQAGEHPHIAPHDSDVIVRTPAVPTPDHCAALQRQWGQHSKP